jgi:hypothetical protein
MTSDTVTCYQTAPTGGWRDTDWFKHASQAKLYHGLNCSRVVPAFAVPRQFHRKGSRPETIFIPLGGPKAHV